MSLLHEVKAMQNPALGAGLLWRFSCEYAPSGSANPVPLPILFLVLPMVYHAKTCDEITSTLRESGVRKFLSKFDKDTDRVLAIHDRALAMRDLSRRSLSIALGRNLMTLVPKQAAVWPNFIDGPDVSRSVGRLFGAAEKLGFWCAETPILEIPGLFKVDL